MNHVAMLLPQIERLGGAEIQVMHLALGLRRRGWRVTVIALSGSGGGSTSQMAAADVQFLSLGMHRGLANPAGWLRLQRWIRAEHPDILHGHLPHAAWMARIVRLLAPVRAVIDTIHTASCGTLGRRLGYRYSNWLADGVTAVSPGAARAYAKARMVTGERLVVIPNGVDTQRWMSTPSQRLETRARLGIQESEFLWLTAGRLEPVKNFSLLLDAFARIASKARLIIVGSGPMQAELQSWTIHLGLAGRVSFPGFDGDLLRWMQAADAFVLPSLWEGLPMVLLEAGACSLPAVATDVPGSRDVLLNGQTGLLAQSGDAQALANAMDVLMHLQPGDRATMGRNARLHIEAHFDLEAIVDRWTEYYQLLLRQRNTVSRRGRTFPNWSGSGAAPAFHAKESSPQCDLCIDAFPKAETMAVEGCDHVTK